MSYTLKLDKTPLLGRKEVFHYTLEGQISKMFFQKDLEGGFIGRVNHPYKIPGAT